LLILVIARSQFHEKILKVISSDIDSFLSMIIKKPNDSHSDLSRPTRSYCLRNRCAATSTKSHSRRGANPSRTTLEMKCNCNLVMPESSPSPSIRPNSALFTSFTPPTCLSTDQYRLLSAPRSQSKTSFAVMPRSNFLAFSSVTLFFASSFLSALR
jgi:hypothetical protein